jgi:phage/plasmid-like protein (TIGR03299 family)
MVAYFDSGFSVREVPWHGMGNVPDTAPETWSAARREADLEWDAIQAPLFGFEGLTDDGKVTYDPEKACSGSYVHIIDKSRVVRSDTGVTLGTPSAGYEVISHDDLGVIIEALTTKAGDLKTSATYETTVSLQGGSKVAVVMRLNEPMRTPGDPSESYPYIALTTAHDGTGACNALGTMIRIVCYNTYSAAEAGAEADGTIFSFRHGSTWRDRLDEARETIMGLRRHAKEYDEFARALGKVKWRDDLTPVFLERFLPMPLTTEISDRVMQNVLDARGTVENILASVTCDGIRGTAFGMVQAGGEFLDHYRGARSQTTKFGRQLLHAEPRKLEAVSIVRELVNV